MEIRLKEGPDLRCEVSGEAEKALIKLQTDKGETPWMGISALKKAYKILAPIAGESAEIVPAPSPQKLMREPQQRLHEAEVVDHAPQSLAIATPSQPSQKLTPRDTENLRIFQDELVALIEDPPPMRDGAPADGLSEAHIRRLIGDHQHRFQDPITLFPILQRHLGMRRERFLHVLEMNRKQPAAV